MSKPRHQLRGNASRPGEDRVKLKLRLPADGSVDLDKLRAALEAQLHGQTGLIVEEPVVAEPVVAEPESAGESSEAWPWIKAKVKANPYIIAALSFALLAFVAGIWLLVLDARGQVGISQPLRWILIGSVVGLAVTFAIVVKNQLTAEQKQWIQTSVPTIVSLFSAVLAAVMGIIYLVQESTKGGSGSSLVAWVFIGSVIAFLVSFALVIRRELTIPDSPTSKGWIWIKKNPKWAYIPSLCLAGIVVLVLFVRAIETGGGTSTDSLAKQINQTATELVQQDIPEIEKKAEEANIEADVALQEAKTALNEAAQQSGEVKDDANKEQKLIEIAKLLESAAEQLMEAAKQAAEAIKQALTPQEKQAAEVAKQDAEEAAEEARELARTIRDDRPAGTGISWVGVGIMAGFSLLMGVGFMIWRRKKALVTGVSEEPDQESSEAESLIGKAVAMIKSYPYLFGTIGLILMALLVPAISFFLLDGGVLWSVIPSSVFCGLSLEALIIAKLLALYRARVIEEGGEIEGRMPPPTIKTFLATAAVPIVAATLGVVTGSPSLMILGSALAALSLPVLGVGTATLIRTRSTSEAEAKSLREWLTWKRAAGLGVAAIVLLGVFVAGVLIYDKFDGPPKKTAQEEPVGTQISFKPEEGYKGRLGMTLGVFGCMGLGLFQLRRIKKARFPDVESLQSGAKAAHIDFWPGFRHFVAAQGGYILVAAATGAIVGVIGFGLRNEMNSTALYAFLWTLPGIFLAGMLIFALGFCGVNLMPALNLTLKPATGESAILRFMRRKIPHIILMGVVLGVSVSVWRTQLPIGDWISYWIKWTLGIGLAVAAYWKWGKLHQTVKNVQPLPVHTRKKLGHVMIFNMPLVAGLTLPIAFGIPLVNGIHWFHVGWIAPLTGLGIFIGMGMLMNFPRLLRHWLEIIFFPGIVAFICWIPWDNSFWYVFAVLTTLFAFGKVMVQHKDTESGSLLVFPQDPNRGYRPVLNPKADGLEIRWSGMVAVMSFVLITLAAAGTWIWSGEPIEFKGLVKPIALTLTILAPFIVIPTWFNFIVRYHEKQTSQAEKHNG